MGVESPSGEVIQIRSSWVVLEGYFQKLMLYGQIWGHRPLFHFKFSLSCKIQVKALPRSPLQGSESNKVDLDNFGVLIPKINVTGL